jgi:hypothetical protein
MFGRSVIHADSDRASGTVGLYPNLPYRLVPGMVALFGRVNSFPPNPRAPCVRPHAAIGFSYTVVAKHPSDRGRGSRGTDTSGLVDQLQDREQDKVVCLVVGAFRR